MNDKIVANVGGNAVFAYEIDELAEALSQRGQNYDTPQGRAALLDQVIGKKLLLLDAKKNLLEHNPQFKAEFEKVKEEMLANFNVQKVIEGITVTDSEAERFFNENKDSFQKGEAVSASHILVSGENEANDIKSRIESGEISFEDAARQFSTCPSSQNGGALGEFTRGQMVPEFDEEVFSMNIGELRGPVKTQFGYHLIKLTGKTEPSEMSFGDVKEQVKAVMLNDKRQKALNSKINQLKILYPVDKM